MDENDLEAFDRFVEKHWGNVKEQETIQTNSILETNTKRRGRPPKTELI